MKNYIYLFVFCILGISAYAQTPTPVEPEPQHKYIRGLFEISLPEAYNIKIYLEDGEILEFNRVAFSKTTLEKKLVLRVLDKTLRVLPRDSDKVKKIRASEISKIEITKVKELDDQPVPPVVPNP